VGRRQPPGVDPRDVLVGFRYGGSRVGVLVSHGPRQARPMTSAKGSFQLLSEATKRRQRVRAVEFWLADLQITGTAIDFESRHQIAGFAIEIRLTNRVSQRPPPQMGDREPIQPSVTYSRVSTRRLSPGRRDPGPNAGHPARCRMPEGTADSSGNGRTIGQCAQN